MTQGDFSIMIHNVSGSNFLAFGSFYDEPVSTDPFHLISRLQMVHTKSVDQLYSYPCEIHLELTQGIASGGLFSPTRGAQDLPHSPLCEAQTKYVF